MKESGKWWRWWRGEQAERSPAPLWVWPAGGAAAALVGALLVSEIRPGGNDALTGLWPGDAAAAATMLQVVAASAITVTTLTFTLTIVALQLASQQFSPRLLREFVRDPVTKRVLAVLVATFVFSLAAMRSLRDDEPVPTVAVALALLLGVASLAAVLGYITHMARVLRVDTMMVAVHDETDDAIGIFYPDYGDPRPASPSELELDSGRGTILRATQSGFVVAVDVEQLVQRACEQDAVVRLEVRPGDHVVMGTPMATAWRSNGDPLPGGSTEEALSEAVNESVQRGYERTLEQDAAFGFRQLEDIAVKAVSPAINDPVTAAHAVGHMADLLVKLTGRRMGPTLHLDADGVGRAIVPDRDLEYYVELACGQLRRFAAAEPTVLNALLRMLRDVATAVRDEEQRSVVRRAAEAIVAELEPGLLESDTAAVRDMCRRVLDALDGRVREAYADRSGETRSI